MTCREYEAWIALWAGDDLTPGEAAALEAHFESCDACRGTAEEMRECCEALAELRDAPLMSVRSAVMERIGQQRRKRWLWWWIPATAAIAGYAVWLLGIDTRIPRPPRAPMIQAAVPANGLEFTPRPKPRPKPVARRKLQPQREESFLVKLVTEDPDIVIYWLFDKKGD